MKESAFKRRMLYTMDVHLMNGCERDYLKWMIDKYVCTCERDCVILHYMDRFILNVAINGLKI